MVHFFGASWMHFNQGLNRGARNLLERCVYLWIKPLPRFKILAVLILYPFFCSMSDYTVINFLGHLPHFPQGSCRIGVSEMSEYNVEIF